MKPADVKPPVKPADLVDQAATRLGELSTVEWIVLGAVLLVLALVGALLWRRRRRRKAPRPPIAEPPPPDLGPDLNQQLRGDWRRFRRGLPAPARRSLDQFHPVVLLGTESAGKAQLVERFGGVAQRRVELGSGAALVDGQLRCLLGGDVLLMDLAEETVRAPRELVAAGLRKALAPTVRRRTPVVVVCLSPEALDRQSEQQLAELGGALRAKLDVIAALRDEPLAVRVVVSDVAGAARFDALFRLLELPGMPAVLPIDDPGDEAVRASLLAYADELGTALTELSPREALDLVGFLDALPHLSGSLSMVLGELFAPAGELTPRPDGLYLVPARGGPNPLAVPEALRRPGPSPLLKHRLVALTGALVAAVALLVAYRSDAAEWDQASAAAWSYELTSEREIDLRLAIRSYTSGARDGMVERLRPGFFTTGPRVVACSFVKQLRQDHLVDQLSDGLAMTPERRRPEHLLHVAALLYASRDGGLRHLIEDRLDDWATAVGLEQSLVVDYLRMAGPYADEGWLERLREATQAPPDDGFDADLDRLLRLLAAGRAWEPGELGQATDLAARLRPALRARARYGSAARVLVTPPLDRLAPVYEVHADRFARLAELWQNQRALEEILRSVLEAPPPPAGAPPRTFAELAAALSPLLVAPAGAAPTALVMDGVEYPVDPGGYLRALRGSDVDRLVADFLARAPEDTALLFFPEGAERQQVGLRVSWPSGLSGARARSRIYSRAAFEQTVKPAVLATAALIERMADRPAQAQGLGQLLDEALDGYAVGYDQELERLYASFAVDVTSETAARRVLAALAGKRSPLRELVRVVAEDAALGLDDDTSGRLDPMLDSEERFGSLAALFQAGKGGEAFVGYQDILRDVGEKLAAPPAPAGKGEGALSSRVSRAGAMALDLMAGAKGNPLDALATWEGEAGLSEEQAEPFRAPLRAVLALGARDVERALAAWNRDLERAAGAELFSRFPFDRRSPDDVDPAAIGAWLHPKSGRLTMEVAPVVASLMERSRTGDGRWHHSSAHPCGSGGVCVDVPARLLDTLDRLASAADVFWDEAGKPRPIALQVTPRPFTVAGRGGPVPELVRLSAGEASVFYFNQRPRRSRVEVDWTRDQVASLSVQLEHGGLSLTPPALVVGGSPWSLLRLMQQADRRGATHTFRVPIDDARVLAVGYDVVDPTAAALGAGGAAAAEASR